MPISWKNAKCCALGTPGTDLPKMPVQDLTTLGLTDQWDESRRWQRVAFGFLVRMPKNKQCPVKLDLLEPVHAYSGDHTYWDRRTGREVTVHVTRERHWLMPASVDNVQALYLLSGVAPDPSGGTVE